MASARRPIKGAPAHLWPVVTPKNPSHRRGGIHRVKDEDRTGSQYDTWKHIDLTNHSKELGVYIKDMKKADMAKAIVKYERNQEMVARQAEVARDKAKKEQEMRNKEEFEKQRRVAAERHKKRQQKQKRRDRGESVSDDSHDDEELEMAHNASLGIPQGGGMGNVGQIQSDDDWESSSAESAPDEEHDSPSVPSDSLRLFEWVDVELPPPLETLEDESDSGSDDSDDEDNDDDDQEEDEDNNAVNACADPEGVGSPRESIEGDSGIPANNEEEDDEMSNDAAQNDNGSPDDMNEEDVEDDVLEDYLDEEDDQMSEDSDDEDEEEDEEPDVGGLLKFIPYMAIKVLTTETEEKMTLPGRNYPPKVQATYVPELSQHTRLAARNGILRGALAKAKIESAIDWNQRTRVCGKDGRMFFTLPPPNSEKSLRDVYASAAIEKQKLSRVQPSNDPKADRERRLAQRIRNKAKLQADVFEASQHQVDAWCYVPAYLDFGVEPPVGSGPIRRTLKNLCYIRFLGCEVPHYYFWIKEEQWKDPTKENSNWLPNFPDMGGLVRVRKPWLPLNASVPKRSYLESELATRLPQVERDLWIFGLAKTVKATELRCKEEGEGSSESVERFINALRMKHPGDLPTVPPIVAEGSVSVALKLAAIDIMGDATPYSPYNGYEPWTSNEDEYWDIKRDETWKPDRLTSLMQRGTRSAAKARSQTKSPSLSGSARFQRTGSQEGSRHDDEFCSPEPDALQRRQSSMDFFTSVSAPTLHGDVEMSDSFSREIFSDMDLECPFCSEDLSGMTSQGQAEHMHFHDAAHSASRRLSSTSDNTLTGTISPAHVPQHRTSFSRHPITDLGNEADTESSKPRKRSRNSSDESEDEERNIGIQKRRRTSNYSSEWLAPTS